VDDLEKEYAELEGRMVKAREQLAVFKAREDEKKQRRSTLLEQLAAEGVDVDDLEGEEARLQKEVREQMEEARGAVGRFEDQLEDRLKIEPESEHELEEV